MSKSSSDKARPRQTLRKDAGFVTAARGPIKGLEERDLEGENESEFLRSLVIPVYRNAENIDHLIDALVPLCRSLGQGTELVFVVDGSPDNSGELLIASRDQLQCPSTIAFHSRNFGAFTAIRTGIELSKGKHVAVMAADLQEPPHLITNFFEILEKDEADVVFGERRSRSDPALRRLASNVFWWAYRTVVLPDLPPGGVDLFACNERVKEAVLSISEPNSSLVAQLYWVGFRRAYVPYVRLQRHHGRSAWNLTRRIRYMMDSVFAFSDAPILFVLWLGLAGCAVSIILGLATLTTRLMGINPSPGYATLIIIVLFFGSAILTAQGIIGCYLWRTFENTKRRPLRIISRIVSD